MYVVTEWCPFITSTLFVVRDVKSEKWWKGDFVVFIDVDFHCYRYKSLVINSVTDTHRTLFKQIIFPCIY
jgi:hypothetical protein